jgi:hypothetical protein
VNIKIIRRSDSKVVKEYKSVKLKQGDTRGQEDAHQRCMRELGQKIATEIVNLPEFREKKQP